MNAPALSAVERVDVEAVNAKHRRSLYATRRKIFPKRAQGSFRRLKWIIMTVTLGIYYLTPWLRWDRGPGAPDQAVLIDFPGRRFYFFFIEIWPQEVYYITGLLILAAVGLFLVTSVWGRAWCGYACPQTVWTDLFIAVERLIEGDRNARIKLDRARWTKAKLGKRLAKHAVWIVIGVVTGGAWIFYFSDAPTLLPALVRGEAPPIAYGFVALLTGTTYWLGGHMREQVCTYMCPWPRIQAAMVDEDTLTVSYRAFRGEPRGAHKRGESWEGRGDCIDCNQCVAVCPMGIDIRDGTQLECITCALCIDACNQVMDRVGRPRGLIAYDTDAGMARRAGGGTPRYRLLRPRTIAYAAVFFLVGAIMLVTLLGRGDLEVNVLHDRNPLFVTLSDGSIRNAYTLKILNKARTERRFEVTVDGIDSADVTVIGGPDALLVPGDRLRSFRVLVTAPTTRSRPITIGVRDRASGLSASTESLFRGPE